MSIVAKRLDGSGIRILFVQVLGTEVGVGPGDIVLDGDPDPSTFKRPLWVVQIHTSQISYKMTDGRHLGKIEKSPYLSNDVTNLYEI